MAQKTVLSLFFALSIALFTSCSDEFKPIDRITAEQLAAMQSSSSEEQSSSGNSSASSSSGEGQSSGSEVPKPEIEITLSFDKPDYIDDNGKKYYWAGGNFPDTSGKVFILNRESAECYGNIYYQSSRNNINETGKIEICAYATCDKKEVKLACVEAEVVPKPTLGSKPCIWPPLTSQAPDIEIQNNIDNICQTSLRNRIQSKVINGPPIWYENENWKDWDGKVNYTWRADSANKTDSVEIILKCKYEEFERVKCRNIKIKNPKANGHIIDDRDGQVYQIVKIGEQTWMAENLNYNANGSKCYVNNNRYYDGDTTCVRHGKLYTWSMANTACPSGWHLPGDEEYEILKELADDYAKSNLDNYPCVNGNCKYSGKMLKAADISSSGSGDWWNGLTNGGYNFSDNCFWIGDDHYGFAALPGGYLDEGGATPTRENSTEIGMWWTASISDVSGSSGHIIRATKATYNNEQSDFYNIYGNNGNNDYKDTFYLSVRCIKD